MKRYEVKPVFNDPDFDLDYEGTRYWTVSGALKEWRRFEDDRESKMISSWHWAVFDTKTGKAIRP